MERDLAGSTIADRYDVLELIGRGGMGAVYRAHDRELDEQVALKVIRPDRTGPDAIESFRHEVKLARRVTHTNIARTFELGFADDVMYCTMELIDGESLRRRLERVRSLPVEQAVSIVLGLCEGLTVAHAAGVIHRDIKPDNVLLASDGRVVLADFGVASLTAGADGALSGTLEYMAPEQSRGEAATPATDIYAVGLVLYEMVTGLRAFAGTMSELIVAKQDTERLTFDIADIMVPGRAPPELREVIGRATARDPGERIGTARELAQRLAPWSAAASIPSVLPTPSSLHNVVVFAPRGMGDSSQLHVAEGVHQELLRKLVVRPRMRVLPRVLGVEVPSDATLVELEATGSDLRAVIRRGDGNDRVLDQIAATLQLPLEMQTITLVARTIADAITDVVEHAPEVAVDDAFEMLLRARTEHRRGFIGVKPALALLETAHAKAPTDWRIAAELASIRARFQFFDPIHHRATRELIRKARDTAPELAETHVAAGYLELHSGDPVVAAIEFRTAIALSPFLSFGHEGLGRMLLEAGFLADAMARLDDALAINPDLSAARWEIARAHALETNWLVHDKLVAELEPLETRAFECMRFTWWRGDRTLLAVLRESYPRTTGAFAPELIHRCFAVALDGTWAQHRDHIVAMVMSLDTPSQRMIALYAQVAAEAAGQAGDIGVCLEMIDHAITHGLFDLHWLDRCPLLEPVRRTPEWTQVRVRVKERADAILDALFCDRTIERGRAGSGTIVSRSE